MQRFSVNIVTSEALYRHDDAACGKSHAATTTVWSMRSSCCGRLQSGRVQYVSNHCPRSSHGRVAFDDVPHKNLLAVSPATMDRWIGF